MATRKPAAKSTAKKPPKPTIPKLVELLTSPDAAQQKQAVKQLARELRIRDETQLMPELFSPLAHALTADASADVRAVAACTLGVIGDERAIPLLCAALSDPAPEVVLSAIVSLGYHKHADAVDPLCRFIERSQPSYMTNAAADALGATGDPRCLETLAKLLRAATDAQSLYPAMAVAKLRAAGTPLLLELLKSDLPAARDIAAAVLEQTGDLRAVEPLRAALADPDYHVRFKAQISLDILQAGAGGDAGGVEGAIQRAMIRAGPLWPKALTQTTPINERETKDP